LGESEIFRLNTELEEKAAELVVARDAADAGNRAKTIFLANMSHELRTPMNGVMGMIDLVLRRATDPKQIDWLNTSKSSAQRMLNVVNDIIDFSKAEANRLPLEEKNFSLTIMVAGTTPEDERDLGVEGSG
jgi:signal transduction histidine kinase